MAIVGYCILDYDGKNISLEHSGSIQTTKNEKEGARLKEIHEDMRTIIQQYQPDICAIEKLFFFRNYTTVMPVAHARGSFMNRRRIIS